MAEERLAVLYSDGSISVLADWADEADGRGTCLSDDKGETDPTKFAKLIRVSVEVLQTLEVPSMVKRAEEVTCPTCGRGPTISREEETDDA